MDFFNALRGLKKSQSGPNLSFSERISLSRRSANHGKQHRDGLSSPLPPRPPSRNAGGPGISGKSSSGLSGRAIENIPENRVVEANRGPGAGLSNTTYVTPQELRIQGESSQYLYGKTTLVGKISLVVGSWGFFGSKYCKLCCGSVTFLVRIRIRGSVSLTNGSGSGSFLSLTVKSPTKNYFFLVFLHINFGRYIDIIFQR
jgi:hypothetical protein